MNVQIAPRMYFPSPSTSPESTNQSDQNNNHQGKLYNYNLFRIFSKL